MGLLSRKKTDSKPGLLNKVESPAIDFDIFPTTTAKSTPVFSSKLPSAKTPSTSKTVATSPILPTKPTPSIPAIQSRNEVLTSRPQTTSQKIISKIPQPIRDVGTQIKEAFLGYDGPDLAGETRSKGGIFRRGEKGTGLIGFKSPLAKYNEAIEILSTVTDSKRATDIAAEITDYGRPTTPKIEDFRDETPKKRLEKLVLNPEEKRAVRKIKIFNNIDDSLSALDFIPLGPIKKIGTGITEQIAKETNKQSIKTILKKELPTVSDEALDIFAEGLRYIDKAEDVQTVLNRIDTQITDKARLAREATQAPNRPAGLLNRSKGEVAQVTPNLPANQATSQIKPGLLNRGKVSLEAGDQMARIVAINDDLAKGAITEDEAVKLIKAEQAKVSQETLPQIKEDPLVEEARKYKSAEEFVKAQPTYYRGGGEGNWISDELEHAEQYGKVKEYFIPKNTKLLNTFSREAEDILDVVAEGDEGYISDDAFLYPDEKLLVEIKKRGYDGFVHDEKNIYIADRASLKTKSQLTDIYNKATKGEEIGFTETFEKESPQIAGKTGPFYRANTMDYGQARSLHGKKFADAIENGEEVTVYRAGKPGETLKDGTFLTADKKIAQSYQNKGADDLFGGPALYTYKVPASDLISVENFDMSELVYNKKGDKQIKTQRASGADEAGLSQNAAAKAKATAGKTPVYVSSGKTGPEQEGVPYTDRTYYHGLSGTRLKQFEKTGEIPKAQQAFGGDFSITDDYNIARMHAGKEGKVIELSIAEDTDVKQADPFSDDYAERSEIGDLDDVGESEFIVNDPSKVRIKYEGEKPKAPIYEGEKDLTTTILKDLEGKTTVSKQYILDATNRGELKQVERDLIREILETEKDTVNVSDFAKKVKAELLPLKRNPLSQYDIDVEPMDRGRYENISLPDGLRGKIQNYQENIYESPIKTSAGGTHFSGAQGSKNYFGHTRIEDMADNKTRRVIEVQSDLYQKGNLERELVDLPKQYKDWEYDELTNKIKSLTKDNSDPDVLKELQKVKKEFDTQIQLHNRAKPLQQYNDPTAHFRMVREEIKKAAQDGKTKLQFPTGETAMKIEGLGEGARGMFMTETPRGLAPLQPDSMKVGQQVTHAAQDWIITDVLGDGKFKAVPKKVYENIAKAKSGELKTFNNEPINSVNTSEGEAEYLQAFKEQFDISGKVDTNNPIYKFYEKEVGRYLKNKYNAELVTDAQGVKWWEVKVDPKLGDEPVTAFKRKPALDSGPKMSIEDIKKYIFKDIPQDKVKLIFTDDLIDTPIGKAVGAYAPVRKELKGLLNPEILLYAKNGQVSLKTAFHEAAHYIFDNFYTKAEMTRYRAIAEAQMTAFDKAKYSVKGYAKDTHVEEYMADQYAKQRLQDEGFKGPLASFFEKLSRIIEQIKDSARKVGRYIKEMSARARGPEGERGFAKNPFADNNPNKDVKPNQDLPAKERIESISEEIPGIKPASELTAKPTPVNQSTIPQFKSIEKDPEIKTLPWRVNYTIKNVDFSRSFASEKAANRFVETKLSGIEEIPELPKQDPKSVPLEEPAENEIIRADFKETNKALKEIDKIERKALPKSDAIDRIFAENTKKIQDTYRQAGSDKGSIEGYTESEETLQQLLLELDLSEAGERIVSEQYRESGYIFSKKPSTFPAWMPEGTRTRDQVDTLLSRIKDIDTISYPKDPRSINQRALVDALLDQMDSRLNVNTKKERQAITKLNFTEVRENERNERILQNFLNKEAKKTEKSLAERDRDERMRKAIEKAAEKIAQEEEYKRLYNQRLAEARRNVGKPGNIFTKIKETLYPLRALDPKTQEIYRNWSKRRLIAKELANEEIVKHVGNSRAGLDQIIAYQAGAPIRYIREAFDSLFTEGRRRGLEYNYRENYLPQVYRNSDQEISDALTRYLLDQGVDKELVEQYVKGAEEMPQEISNRLKLNPSFTKKRVFPNYLTAIEYGLKPRYEKPIQLIAYYREEMEKTLANRKFLEDLLEQGMVLPVELTPDHWKALNLPFSPKGYYAEPKLAKLLNGQFRDEEDLGVFELSVKRMAQLSRKLQEIALSAGIPKTTVNFFAIGQMIKQMTLGDYKAPLAFMRANVDSLSQKFFAENKKYTDLMASQGIDLGGRIASYDKLYQNLLGKWGELGKKVTKKPLTKRSYSGFMDLTGDTFDNLFNEKTFGSFMPQLYTQTFKDTYLKASKKGLSEYEASKIAADITRKTFGLMEDVGRGKLTEDSLSALFFAPKFREGIINVLGNTGQAGYDFIKNLGGLRSKVDPSLRNNRRLFAGMIITYALYNALNYKLNGEYMWENESGKEFALKIPLPDGENYIYIEFMPSFLAFARNMASGTIALAKGDLDTATKKYGSLFSMPIKIGSEVLSNRDYFDRPIYKDTDSTKEKALKIAQYVGLQPAHPYIKELIKYAQEKTTWWQSLIVAAELPIKFSTKDKINTSKFYEAMEVKEQERADMKKRIMPLYTEAQALIAEGRKDEANALVKELSDEDYEIYKSIRTAEKAKATKAAEAKMYDFVKRMQELKKTDPDAANAEVRKLSDEEYRIYKLAKKNLGY